MAPIVLSLSSSKPKGVSYTPVPFSPYHDEDTAAALSNSVLCPRYAESDISDTPTSPASIESFDILDSMAWRRGYTSYDTPDGRRRTIDVLRKRWRKSKAQVVAVILLFTLFVVGYAVGGWAVVKDEDNQVQERCREREGGKRCDERERG